MLNSQKGFAAFMQAERGFAQVLVLLFLLLAIPVGLYLVQHPAIFKPQAAEQKQNPVKIGNLTGLVDTADCDKFIGWAKDLTTQNPIKVAVYSDRESDGKGGFFWGNFEAPIKRSGKFPYKDKNHGFNFPTPAGLKNGRDRIVWIYAISESGNQKALLGQKTFKCASPKITLPKSKTPSTQMYLISPNQLNGKPMNRLANSVSKDDFYTNSSLQFFTVALQGLVNRIQPRIYLRDEMYDLNVWSEDHWLSLVESKIGKSMIQVPNNDPIELAKIFKSDSGIKGLAVYDPAVWTDSGKGDLINLLTGFCAINNCLPVTPTMRTALQANGLNWPIIADFRAGKPITDLGYKFNHEGIYSYMAEQLVKDSSQQVVGNFHPQLYIIPRDYFFENKILPFFIRNDASSFEENQIKKVLNVGMPTLSHGLGQVGSHNDDWIKGVFGKYSTSQILGKYDEGPTWQIFSKAGLTMDYIHAMANLSVHSGFPSNPLTRKKHQAPVLDRTKIYLTLNLSDGDNISWDKQLWGKSWQNPRPQIPLNWSFNPLLYDLAPDILEWFYQNVTNNDYLMPSSGAGSIENASFPSSLLTSYIALSCQYLKNMDQQTNYLTFSAVSQTTINSWAKSSCLKSIFSDYNVNLGLNGLPPADYPNSTRTENRIGVFRPIVGFHLSGQTIDGFLVELTNKQPAARPAFMNIWVLGNRAIDFADDKSLETMVSKLDKNIYQVVTADDFVSLYQQVGSQPLTTTTETSPTSSSGTTTPISSPNPGCSSNSECQFGQVCQQICTLSYPSICKGVCGAQTTSSPVPVGSPGGTSGRGFNP